MADVDAAVERQKHNIGERTGRPFDDWVALARDSGRTRHAEIVGWLKAEHGLGHGDANLVAMTALRPDTAPVGDGLVDAMYAGPKSAIRPLHDEVVAVAVRFGPDVILAPKQAYVSLRRAKQFGTVGPASGGRLEVGLNLKGVEPHGRLEATTGMCTHRVRLAAASDIDDELRDWLREAYERA